MYELRQLWANQDDKTRLEMIKSIIWTTPDMHTFYQKVIKELSAEKFGETLD